MDEFQEKLNTIMSSPSEMEKIMALARSISGDTQSAPKSMPEAEPPPEPPPQGGTPFSLLDGIDPKTMGMLIGFLKENGQDNEKTALIGTITPYLREERRAKVTQAIKIARMAKLAKTMFGKEGGESL